MLNLFLEGAKHSPEVDFNAETCILSISGQSYHEHAEEFYAPILHWLETFLNSCDKSVLMNMKFSYFNTASSRCILDILELLEKYEKENQGKVTINWLYKESDFDMLESGEDYQADVEVRINLLSY